jgi:hypothetical protein
MRTMPQLTRRREPNTTQETWGVYYGDVQVGTIAERAGKGQLRPFVNCRSAPVRRFSIDLSYRQSTVL